MKRKFLLYIPIILIAIIVLILIAKFINFDKENSKNNNETKKMTTEDKITTIINKSYTHYLLTEGNLPTNEEDEIFIDNIKYQSVALEEINSKSDIKDLIDSLFTNDYANGRYEEVFEKIKFVDFNNKLYVNIDEEPCELNYSLEDKLYEITKKNDNESELKFTIDENHNYIYPLYNEDGIYKIIDSLYGCSKNIKDNY